MKFSILFLKSNYQKIFLIPFFFGSLHLTTAYANPVTCDELINTSPPPQIVLNSKKFGGCYACVANIIEHLMGTTEENEFSYEYASVQRIKPEQVDLTKAKVLYLANEGVDLYFHVVLLLDNYIYDPNQIAKYEAYAPVPMEEFFKKILDDKFGLRWIYEIPALGYDTSVHSLHRGALYSRFLNDPEFTITLKGKLPDIHKEYMRFIREALDDPRGLISEPQPLEQWLKKNGILKRTQS